MKTMTMWNSCDFVSSLNIQPRQNFPRAEFEQKQNTVRKSSLSWFRSLTKLPIKFSNFIWFYLLPVWSMQGAWCVLTPGDTVGVMLWLGALYRLALFVPGSVVNEWDMDLWFLWFPERVLSLFLLGEDIDNTATTRDSSGEYMHLFTF